jgi:hypothetical protein
VAKITVRLALFALGAAAQSQQRLEVKIDPRIELMAVTQVLADYGWTGLLSKQDTAYRRDVDMWFAPFKQHAAVKRFAELAKAGYTFDGPAGTMICLSAPPELKTRRARGRMRCAARGRSGEPGGVAGPTTRFRRGVRFRQLFPRPRRPVRDDGRGHAPEVLKSGDYRRQDGGWTLK